MLASEGHTAASIAINKGRHLSRLYRTESIQSSAHGAKVPSAHGAATVHQKGTQRLSAYRLVACGILRILCYSVICTNLALYVTVACRMPDGFMHRSVKQALLARSNGLAAH